jgi:hypothetical protein
MMFTAAAFQGAHPFPHAIMDEFIPAELIRDIHSEWPADGWREHRHANSDKRGCWDWDRFGAQTRRLLEWLISAEFVERLSDATGIAPLVADPLLSGGGLHETLQGGFLNIHADFNVHPETRLYRRLNLLLFLNEEWRTEWGGCLEFWDKGKSKAASILPIAGRAVVFATTDTSFHGHPVPLNRPGGGSRRSIALYYYSPDSPEANPYEHSTLYVGEPA